MLPKGQKHGKDWLERISDENFALASYEFHLEIFQTAKASGKKLPASPSEMALSEVSKEFAAKGNAVGIKAVEALIDAGRKKRDAT